jgi:hypothetical protein
MNLKVGDSETPKSRITAYPSLCIYGAETCNDVRREVTEGYEGVPIA